MIWALAKHSRRTGTTICMLSAVSRCAKTPRGQTNQLWVPQFLAAVSPNPNPGLCPQGILEHSNKTLTIQGQVEPAGVWLIVSHLLSSDSLFSHCSRSSARRWPRHQFNCSRLTCVLCFCGAGRGVVAADLSFNLIFLWDRAALEASCWC